MGLLLSVRSAERARLRLGEARNLELYDVNLDAALLKVRNAKFGRARLVPLHRSTCDVLADYIARHQRHWPSHSVSPYLFVSSWGNRLDGGQVHRAFYALSRQIGLRGEHHSHGPRLHDFRHSCARAMTFPTPRNILTHHYSMFFLSFSQPAS